MLGSNLKLAPEKLIIPTNEKNQLQLDELSKVVFCCDRQIFENAVQTKWVGCGWIKLFMQKLLLWHLVMNAKWSKIPDGITE